jgi:hypothetical protein
MSDSENWPETAYFCNGGGCVMVERIAGCVVLWDSKNPYGARHVFSKREWAEFRLRVMGYGALPRSLAWLSRVAVGAAKFARMVVG